MVANSVMAKARARSSPGKILRRIIDNNVSGRLVFQDTQGRGIFWEVFVGEGKLHFASSTQNALDRLQYCVNTGSHQFDWTDVPDMGTYDLMCHFWKSGSLSLKQVRKLVLEVTQDALTQVLASSETDVQFERAMGLDPILLDVPIQLAVSSCKQEILGWRSLRPVISSPLQRLSAINLEKFAACMGDRIAQLSNPSVMEALLADAPTFYRVADRFNVNVLELATMLKPLVESGDITLDSEDTDDSPPMTIACIDDSRAVQRKVRLTLEAAGYEVLELMEPARALTALVRAKPSAILLDITMPELSGYELCRMLRQSAALKDVPIVMLTGRDGAIDRLRARMAGSTDYMTKPFNSQVLLSRIQQLTSSQGVQA